MELTVFIPAIKKQAAFRDDLVKKLAGKTLVQRAIDKAVCLQPTKTSIHLLTDSEEISLIGDRNGISVVQKPSLTWCAGDIGQLPLKATQVATDSIGTSLVLSPYAPLLTTDTLLHSLEVFFSGSVEVLRPVRTERRFILDGTDQSVEQLIFGSRNQTHLVESTSFIILRNDVLFGNL